MPLIRGVAGDPWNFCDRCGCPFRLSQMEMQNGLLLCLPNNCFDGTLMFKRDIVIQEVLSDSNEEMVSQTSIKRSEDNSQFENVQS